MVIPETVTRTGPITQDKTEITNLNNPHIINPTQIYTITTNFIVAIGNLGYKTMVIKVQTSIPAKDFTIKHIRTVDREQDRVTVEE